MGHFHCEAHANCAESFRSMLRRDNVSKGRKMSPKHLRRYISAFSGRHNEHMEDALGRTGGERPAYKDLKKVNGLDFGVGEVAL